jgi:hypothetical protein
VLRDRERARDADRTHLEVHAVPGERDGVRVIELDCECGALLGPFRDL